jgi:hypothetical protein
MHLPPRGFLRQFSASHLLCLMLGATTLMAAACGADPPPGFHRAKGGAAGDDPASAANGTSGGGGATSRGNGTGYDPQTPTNRGPGLNPAGFAAVASIVQAHCSECHHPGTWLDLESGADAATAAKMIHAVEAGTMPPAPRTALSAGDLATIKAWSSGQTPAVMPADVDPPNVAVEQLLDANTLATYRAALPKVGWTRLSKILESPSTLFWDKATIPPAYQDTVGDGSSLPFGARLNSTGKSLIVPEGQKLFSADGKTWAFPFGHTAGTDAADDLFIVNFLALPAEGGALLPVAYKIDTGTVSGLPIKRWSWSFPTGTIVGEILMLRDGSSVVTSEIRTRERFADGWATDAFRPFPTASTLAAAVQKRRPDWKSAPNVNALVTALGDTTTLTPKHLDSPAFSNLVTLDGAIDAPLPDVGDDALVRDLLTTTTFVGSYGTTWKAAAGSGGLKAFGPSGTAGAGLSIVPHQADLGLLEVRETTCRKCHDQGGTFIGDLVDEAILYGDIWGVDRIFSFHPFEPSQIDASGNENRSVRAGLAGIVKPYDPAVHPSSRYSFYRPAP